MTDLNGQNLNMAIIMKVNVTISRLILPYIAGIYYSLLYKL